MYITLAVVVNSCKESGTNPQDKEFVLPDSNLTFDDVGPMLLAKCGTSSGCHNPTDRAGGLDMTSYQTIMLHQVITDFGSEKLVVPGNGTTSFLHRILLQSSLGVPRMPKDGPYLNSNNVNAVRVWIDEGALFTAD